MKTCDTIQSLQFEIKSLRAQNLTIGLVPTMGALHQGHISLINKSTEECDITICSIYVNPTQFNSKSDLERYPKTLAKDIELLKSTNCNIVFTPSNNEMYPEPATLKMSFGELEKNLEGVNRPGHFSGVGIVVSKLFNIVQPDMAYFGQKDLQQVAIINSLVQQLSFPIKIITCPIIREKNGLAQSSRNQLLNPEEREAASIIYTCLQNCVDKVDQFSIAEIEENAINQLKEKSLSVEYVSFINISTFAPAEKIESKKTAICVAASIGGVRLIDNVIL